MTFVPAVLVPEVSEGVRTDGARAVLEEGFRRRLEVVCHGGRRIVVDGNFDADALRRLLSVVEDR